MIGKNRFALLLLILMYPAAQGIAADYDLNLLDVSNAVISIAGPRQLYIRSATYGTEAVSFILEAEDDTGRKWHVTDIYTGDTPLIPDDIFLNFAEINPLDNGEIEISGIILDGRSYTAKMKILDSSTLIATGYPREGVPSNRWIRTLEGLKKQFSAETAEASKAAEAAMQKLLTENNTQALQITSLTEGNRQYEETVGTLNQKNREYAEQVNTLQNAVEKLESSDKEKDGQITVLTEVNRQLKETFLEAMERLKLNAGGGTDTGTGTASGPVFNRTILTGFGKSTPQMGSWRIGESEATQVDSSQYFAKLVLPVEQTTQPTLFSFYARSKGEGWVGLGLHFFATRGDGGKGYGYGDSLLFWLTRDPEYYGTGDTHAQLYRSNDEVNMEMVLDAIIEEPIHDYLKVDILYEPMEKYFSVYINGEEKLKYKTWFDIESGIEIAFRTLKGDASFKDLVVKTIE